MANKDFKVKNGLIVGNGAIIDSDLNVKGQILVDGSVVISATGDVIGRYAGFDSDFSSSLSSVSTDSLSEGLTNLYYTDARVQSYLTSNSYATTSDIDSAVLALIDAAPAQLDTLNELAAAINDDSDFAGTITTLIGTKVSKVEFSTYFDSNFGLKSTGDLTEGVNLYYTTSRADSAFDVRLGTKSTDDLLEGQTNLYYTTSRADSAFDVRLATKSTTDLLEGDNLYYTTSRADSAFDVRLGTKSTTDLLEGDNLYYTTSRADSAFDVRLATKSTTDLLEGDNLYYTKSRVDSDIAALVDASYVENIRPPEAIFNVVNNGTIAYTFSGDGFASSVDNPALYLQKGMTYKFSVNASGHPFEIRVSNGGSAYNNGVTNNGAQIGDVVFTVPMDAPDTLYYQCTIHSGMGAIIYVTEAASLTSDDIAEGNTNLYYTTARADSAFDVRLGTKSTTDLSEGDNLYYTSARVDSDILSLVDSAYIQLRQVDIFRDSGFITGLIDSAYINARVEAGGGTGTVDSAQTISLITDTVDSAYIQARQIIGGGTGTVDSAQTISLITDTVDSAYINARVEAGGGTGTVDSAQTISLITDTVDSAYIQSRQLLSATLSKSQIDTFFYSADSGQTLFFGPDDNGNTLSYSNGNLQVHMNGLLLTDSVDYTAQNGSTVILTADAESGSELIITAYNLASLTLDSSPTIDLIRSTVDSAYIQARVTAGTDSAAILALIDSDYIQARVTAGTDSAAILALIDSDYIQARIDSSSIAGLVSGTLNQIEAISNFYYTATAGQLTFVDSDNSGKVLSYNPSAVEVYVNGIHLLKTDYTATNGTSITLIDSSTLGDEIAITSYAFARGLDSAEILDVISAVGYVDAVDNYFYTTSAGVVSYGDSDTRGNVLSYTPGTIQVYLNGILLSDSADYVAENGTSVTLQDSAGNGSELVITRFSLLDIPSKVTSVVDSNYIAGFQISTTISNAQSTAFDFYRFVADSNQTIFSGNDAGGNPLSYDPDGVLVYLDGLLVSKSNDYVVDSGNSITLNQGVQFGTEVFVTNYRKLFSGIPDETVLNSFVYTADSGQAIFTGSDDNGAALNLRAGQSLVFLNGLILKDGNDYSTNDSGTSVTFTDPADLNDIVTVVNITKSTLGAWKEITSSTYSALAGQKLIIDTSSAQVDVLLPATGVFGDEIRIIDGAGNAAINNIRILPNGGKIQGAAETLTVDVNGAAFGLVYYNLSRGWVLMDK